MNWNDNSNELQYYSTEFSTACTSCSHRSLETWLNMSPSMNKLLDRVKVSLTILILIHKHYILIMHFLQRHCVIVFVGTSAHALLGAFPLSPQLCAPWLSACFCRVLAHLLGHQM